MIVVAIGASLFLIKSQDTTQESDLVAIDFIANDLITTVEKVNLASPGTKLFVKQKLPARVLLVSVPHPNELVFTIQTETGTSELLYTTTAAMDGSFLPVDPAQTQQISKLVVLKDVSGSVIVCTLEFGCS